MLPAFLASYLGTLVATPLAIRIARRTGFVDRPAGYKLHAVPTPYLGGAAVFVGFLAGALAEGVVGEPHLGPLFAGAAFLWVVGTVDDRIALGPRVRVLAETLVAILLWNSGLGWSLFPGEVLDLVVTVLWIVGIVNAFNLMDNLDGAAATVAGVSAAGIALLAAGQGPEPLTALSVAACGACVGFLHFNLSRPARVFLGDGGSMLLGFLVAALTMAIWRLDVMVGPAILPAIMFAGLPVLDMTLVIVSRKRRGVPLGTGGRDHITHRLLSKLGSTWGVALALAAGQGVLCLAAIGMMDLDRHAMIAWAGVSFLLGAATIAVFETPLFRPEPAARTAGGPGSGPPPALRDQRSDSAKSEANDPGSTSTPRRAGATSGRSIPSTELGP